MAEYVLGHVLQIERKLPLAREQVVEQANQQVQQQQDLADQQFLQMQQQLKKTDFVVLVISKTKKVPTTT